MVMCKTLFGVWFDRDKVCAYKIENRTPSTQKDKPKAQQQFSISAVIPGVSYTFALKGFSSRIDAVKYLNDKDFIKNMYAELKAGDTQ